MSEPIPMDDNDGQEQQRDVDLMIREAETALRRAIDAQSITPEEADTVCFMAGIPNIRRKA